MLWYKYNKIRTVMKLFHTSFETFRYICGINPHIIEREAIKPHVIININVIRLKVVTTRKFGKEFIKCIKVCIIALLFG